MKLLPASHHWPLATDVVEPILRPLEDQRILTMLDYGELPGTPTYAYETLSALLKAFGHLPILLQRVPWGAQRVVTALMDRFENLHIEFSTYQISRGLETYVRRYGHERLLFGTGLPAMSAGAARAYVDYAQIPDDAKANIAGGNLSRLLGGVELPEVSLPDDPLLVTASAGEPLSEFDICDAHCHVLHENSHGAGSYVMYGGDADGILEIADVMGVRKSVLFSWIGPIGSDSVDGNDIVARAIEKHPDRVLGLAYVSPPHLSEAELCDELHRRAAQGGWVGLKPYPRAGLPYDDPLYEPAWRIAEQHGWMVLAHIGQVAGTTDTIARLAERYANVQWVIAHSGGSFAMARGVTAVMKDHANIWAELTLTPVTNGVIEWMIGEAGDDRILYGSDAPMRDPRPQLGWVVWADAPLESRRKILGGNLRRVLAMAR